MNDPDLASTALVTEVLGGRQQAFAELMRLHREPIYRLARSYTGDAEEALDITQDCFANAFTALRSYDPARPFRLWIRRIAVNKCHDWSRRRAVRRFFTFAAPIEDGIEIADAAALPDQAVADAMELDLVSARIAQLPVPLRDVLILRTIDGLSQAETAQLLGITQKAVETRLHRARAGLIERLGDQARAQRKI